MKKKKYVIIVIIFSTLLSTISVYLYQIFFSPNFLINQNDKFLIINDDMNFKNVREKLIQDTILNDVLSFSFLSKSMNYDKNIKTGAYKIKSNMSNYDLIRMLRSGNQTPIYISFNYARKIEDFSKIITKDLKISEYDFMNYINDNKNIYGFNEQNILSMFLPDTYEIYWNISTENLFKKMNIEYNKFWNKKREDKLNKLNINKVEILIISYK